ncbi:three-prime repair exonuclease 1 [Zootoca vivipara]|uniref:three-prime repair exonuclease 1 n=1 Tax=Zootoca vivipara TaxID=8524 RepID=UPI00293B8D02|nr:three-prime repair exonuclease 1 [Zootoca vivipara]
MWSTYPTPSKPIETFVFMDLEATGLPPSQPKIAEMCLFAVSRHSLENPQYSNPCPKPLPLLPRLADKLSICINPDKQFTPEASLITGLTNEAFAMNKKQTFNLHLLHMIVAFFRRQQPPICLVAHNGNRYDFPLLRAEFSALGHLAIDGIYCADTIKAMKALDGENNQLQQFGYQPSAPGSRKKYALRDLYFKFYREYPPNSHNAEGDVIALINIFQQRASDLMCWMDSNAMPFNSIRAMYKEKERYASFSKTPGNIQPLHSNHLQMQSRQRVAANTSRWPFPEDGKPADNNYIPLNNRSSGNFFIIPDEIKSVKGILILFLGLVVGWVAVKYPV